MSDKRTIRSEERILKIPIGQCHHDVYLTYDQKQTVILGLDADLVDNPGSVLADVILYTDIGRFEMDPSIHVKADVFTQIEQFDYSFFRYTPRSPTSVVFPPFVTKLGITVKTTDNGNTWSIEKLTLFDD